MKSGPSGGPPQGIQNAAHRNDDTYSGANPWLPGNTALKANQPEPVSCPRSTLATTAKTAPSGETRKCSATSRCIEGNENRPHACVAVRRATRTQCTATRGKSGGSDCRTHTRQQKRHVAITLKSHGAGHADGKNMGNVLNIQNGKPTLGAGWTRSTTDGDAGA